MRTYLQRLGLLVGLLCSLGLGMASHAPDDQLAHPVAKAPVVIVGATPAGIMAAIAAARMGTDVLLLEPTDHVGGVVTNGLTIADLVKRNAFGGLVDEYLGRIVAHYEKRYGKESEQVKLCKHGEHPEPHVTELIFNQMLAEQPAIKIYYRHRLKQVLKKANTLMGVVMEDLAQPGTLATFSGAVFIDASYEGDLAAMAGAPYRTGRESRTEFNEPQAGVIYSRFGLNEYLPGSTGEADKATQAFCFRLSMTRVAENRVPVPKPELYNRKEYLHFLDDIRAGKLAPLVESHRVNRDKLMQPIQLWQKPNNKVEVNSEHVHPEVGAPRESSDLAEENWAYPDASYAERERIVNRYWNYQLGLIWFLQNDPEVPESYRSEAAQWGFCKDEFVTNNHVPRQIYVRQSRRIEGDYFLTQHDADVVPELKRTRLQPTSIGVAEYPFDSHGCHKYDPKHPGVREGYFYIRHEPFQIPYGVLVPKKVEGLLVPVCLSASHVAYQAVRMEPLYMSLGQVAGVAAVLSLREKKTVRNLSIQPLQRELIRQKLVLTYLEDIGINDPDREALQFLATYGRLIGYRIDPDATLSPEQSRAYLSELTRSIGFRFVQVLAGNQPWTVRQFAQQIYQQVKTNR